MGVGFERAQLAHDQLLVRWRIEHEKTECDGEVSREEGGVHVRLDHIPRPAAGGRRTNTTKTRARTSALVLDCDELWKESKA